MERRLLTEIALCVGAEPPQRIDEWSHRADGNREQTTQNVSVQEHPNQHETTPRILS